MKSDTTSRRPLRYASSGIWGFWPLALSAAFVAGLFTPVQGRFFEISLQQIFQMVSAPLAALVVGFFFKRYIDYSVKFRELMGNLITAIEQDIEEALTTGLQYFDCPEDKKRVTVLDRMRRISNSIALLVDASSRKKLTSIMVHQSDLKDHFFMFKSALTGGPFGGKKPVLTKNELTEVYQMRANLCRVLLAMKLDLYAS